MKDIFHKWLKIPYVLGVGVDTKHQHDELTVVFVHGLASSHHMWQPVLKRLTNEKIRVISLDLLGFGDSPKPAWQRYDAKVHARSLRRTLRRLQVTSPVIIVGHSLGSLVAIKYAAMYPWAVDRLILCSPPFYEPTDETSHSKYPVTLMQADDIYLALYKYTRGQPELAKKLASLIRRARLMGKHFVVDDVTLPAIASSLEMSIENQRSLADAKTLDVPIEVLYGQFDPFVIKRHLKTLAKSNPSVTLKMIPTAAHEIYNNRLYEKAIVAKIEAAYASQTNQDVV